MGKKTANKHVVTWDDELLATACGYHDEDAETVMEASGIDASDLDDYEDEDEDEDEDDEPVGVPVGSDRLRGDSCGYFFVERKRREIESFLQSVRIDGKKPKKIDIAMDDGYQSGHDERSRDQAASGKFPAVTECGSAAWIGFGMCTGDRWYVAGGWAWF